MCVGDRGEIQVCALGNPVKWMKEFLQKEQKLEEKYFQQNWTIIELLLVVFQRTGHPNYKKNQKIWKERWNSPAISISRHRWSCCRFNKSWKCSWNCVAYCLSSHTKWILAETHSHLNTLRFSSQHYRHCWWLFCRIILDHCPFQEGILAVAMRQHDTVFWCWLVF